MRKDPSFLTTYANVICSDWPAVADMIREYSKPVREQHTEEAEPSPLLTQEQFTTALSGPYANFLSQLLRSFSKFAQVKLNYRYHEEEVFKRKNKPPLPEQLETDAFKKLSNSDFEQVSNELIKLAGEQQASWADYVQNAIDTLREELFKQNISLADNELQELKDRETATDVFGRLTDLQLEFVKVQANPLTFADYFKAKAAIAIKNALSRQQQAIDDNGINAALKKLKGFFSTLKKDEAATLKAQLTELNEKLKSLPAATV